MSLLAAHVLHHVGHDGGVGHGGRAHGDFAIVVDQKHAVKSDRLPGFDGQALDFQRVARGDTILFAASFQYGVHKFPRQRGKDNTKKARRCQRRISEDFGELARK